MDEVKVIRSDTDSDEEIMLPISPTALGSFAAFSYQDPLLTVPEIKINAIPNETSMIALRRNVNIPDNKGNTALHIAVIRNQLKLLDLLLLEAETNPNCQNHEGDTPLLLSIKMHRSDSFVDYILAADCDVNIANNMGETPLHISVARSSTFIAHKLLKIGAKVNAVDGNGYCTLHHAVENNNLEAVNMLLYYCADVDIRCSHNLTPFMYAVNDSDKLDIAKALFDYCTDFSYITTDGYTPLMLAANSKSNIAIDIVKAGADINWITPDCNSVVSFSLYYDNAHLFKTVWSKFNHHSLLESVQPFLFTFMYQCCFPTCEWLECMYEILNCPLTFDLIEHCRNSIRTHYKRFFCNLMEVMHKRSVSFNDRLTLIQIFLSFGAEFSCEDLNFMYTLYGFNEEFEIAIQLGNLHETYKKLILRYPTLSTFILGKETSYSSKYICDLFKNECALYQCTLMMCGTEDIYALNAFAFFSLSYHSKQKLIEFLELASGVDKAIAKKLERVPEIPSLVELSRNQFRKYIKRIYAVKKPYRFHETICNLNIPSVIKDIIRFKKPLYE